MRPKRINDRRDLEDAPSKTKICQKINHHILAAEKTRGIWSVAAEGN
jgi:hypothetical protein